MRVTELEQDHQDPWAPLVLRSAAGDHQAYRELHAGFSPRVLGLVLRVLRDPQQSEEVAQEVLLEIWQKASRFDPARGSALGWALTIAHRRAVDRVRSTSSRRQRETAHAVRHHETAYDQTASSALATVEATRVRAALSSLPSSQREAVQLAFLDGHTQVEVAQLTGTALGTIKWRIRAGLTQLRSNLALDPALESAPTSPAAA